MKQEEKINPNSIKVNDELYFKLKRRNNIKRSFYFLLLTFTLIFALTFSLFTIGVKETFNRVVVLFISIGMGIALFVFVFSLIRFIYYLKNKKTYNKIKNRFKESPNFSLLLSKFDYKYNPDKTIKENLEDFRELAILVLINVYEKIKDENPKYFIFDFTIHDLVLMLDDVVDEFDNKLNDIVSIPVIEKMKVLDYKFININKIIKKSDNIAENNNKIDLNFRFNSNYISKTIFKTVSSKINKTGNQLLEYLANKAYKLYNGDYTIESLNKEGNHV